MKKGMEEMERVAMAVVFIVVRWMLVDLSVERRGSEGRRRND